MRTPLTATVLALCLTGPCGIPGVIWTPDAKGFYFTGQTEDRLQGDWQMVAVERVLHFPVSFDPPGQPTKFKSVRKVVGEDRCRFEKWTFKGKEVIRQNLLMPTTDQYRIDAKKDPKQIDFTELVFSEVTKKKERGSTQLGIYRLEGDALTICVNDQYLVEQPPGSPPNVMPRPTHPTAFEAKADEKSSFTLIRLKRPAKQAAAPRKTTPPEGGAAVIAKNPKLLALARERQAAARQEFEGRMKNIATGRATPDPWLVDACHRLLAASLDVAKSREEQEAAMEEHWVQMYAIEDIEEEKYRVGKEDPTVYFPFVYARLDAELRLEMFRLRQPPKK
jgi:uncharacterized protein (TIGR03067 family)